MIDENLRRRMENAYLWGQKELALELSQELDKQITEEQNKKAWSADKKLSPDIILNDNTRGVNQ